MLDNAKDVLQVTHRLQNNQSLSNLSPVSSWTAGSPLHAAPPTPLYSLITTSYCARYRSPRYAVHKGQQQQQQKLMGTISELDKSLLPVPCPWWAGKLQKALLCSSTWSTGYLAQNGGERPSLTSNPSRVFVVASALLTATGM